MASPRRFTRVTGQFAENGIDMPAVRAPLRALAAAPLTVRIGLVLFAIGSVLLLVTVIPFFLGKHNWPLWLNLTSSLLVPVGMVLAAWGAFAQGRAEQKQALRDVQALSQP